MRDEKADVAVFGYVGAGRLAGAIQTLFDWNDENGRATELQARFASIDLIDTVATVRLELDNWTAQRFTSHTAFDDPTARNDAPPRESIEVRTLISYAPFHQENSR